MRLWTVHPRYLDAKGLVALWREGLLAQKVLQNATRGYKNHPQLTRFRSQIRPTDAIAAYLIIIADEAAHRGYRFDISKIADHEAADKIQETRGQLLFEWRHLRAKLRLRSPKIHGQFRELKSPEPHPLFDIVPGEINDWEKSARRR